MRPGKLGGIWTGGSESEASHAGDVGREVDQISQRGEDGGPKIMGKSRVDELA